MGPKPRLVLSCVVGRNWDVAIFFPLHPNQWAIWRLAVVCVFHCAKDLCANCVNLTFCHAGLRLTCGGFDAEHSGGGGVLSNDAFGHTDVGDHLLVVNHGAV